MDALKTLQETNATLLQEIKSLEGKVSPLLENERKNSAKLTELGNHHEAALKEIRENKAEMDKKCAELTGELERSKEYIALLEKKGLRPDLNDDGEEADRRSIGQVLTEGKEFQNWIESKGSFEKINLKRSLGYHQRQWEMQQKDSIVGTTATDLRDILSTERPQTIYYNPLNPNRIRDLIPTINTVLGLVAYLREVAFSNNAATVAEGGTKPESDTEINQYEAAMRVIAHAMTIPRQLLEDVPAFRTYLDSRMYDGLKVVEDDQLLYGSGSGSNIQGLLTTPGIQSYDMISDGATGDTKIDALRKAMTLADLAFYPVSGVIVHPLDWQDIELQKDSQERYVWVNVQTGGTPMLWRVPVVVTPTISHGQALMGAFNKGTIVWDRQMANMRISEHHLGVFLENRIVVLLEERLCQTPVLPKAFIECILNATVVS